MLIQSLNHHTPFIQEQQSNCAEQLGRAEAHKLRFEDTKVGLRANRQSKLAQRAERVQLSEW